MSQVLTLTDEHDDEPQEGVDWALWRRLLQYTRPYRRDVRLLMLGALGAAATEVAFPLLTRVLVDDVAAGTAVDFVGYGLRYAALIALMVASVWLFIYVGGRLRTHIGHDIRRDGFENLQRLSFSYFDRRPVGWLMARMTADCDRLTMILAWGVLDIVWGTALTLGIAAAMLAMNVGLGLLVLAVVPVLAWVSLRFQKRLLLTSRNIRGMNSRITAAYNEHVMGVRTSKIFVREQHDLARFGELTAAMQAASVRNAVLAALYLPLVMTLGSVAAGLALAQGGFSAVAGSISVGTLVAFVTYAGKFFEPVQELAAVFAELQMAQAAAERIVGLVEAEPEIVDGPDVRAAAARGDVHAPMSGALEFRDVCFAYETGEPVLEHFDLVVQPGETIALVGATGGGKSTIVNLLCRFYEPTSGEILIDGVDYRRHGLHWLHAQLGIVSQVPHLFRGTITDNIRYGRLDAGDDEVREAARLAGADDVIAALPDGFDAEVGEGGARLSTGARQLVSFARAILARPRLVVLDEATSSVDTETEERIQAGLEHVLADRTSFVIAHRLSTVRSADRILVIDGGRMLEVGSHAELMARRGRYHALYTRQSLRDVSRVEGAWPV